MGPPPPSTIFRNHLGWHRILRGISSSDPRRRSLSSNLPPVAPGRSYKLGDKRRQNHPRPSTIVPRDRAKSQNCRHAYHRNKEDSARGPILCKLPKKVVSTGNTSREKTRMDRTASAHVLIVTPHLRPSCNLAAKSHSSSSLALCSTPPPSFRVSIFAAQYNPAHVPHLVSVEYLRHLEKCL